MVRIPLALTLQGIKLKIICILSTDCVLILDTNGILNKKFRLNAPLPYLKIKPLD